MDSSVPCLKAAFKRIREAHREMVNYTFQEEGRQAYIAAHDHLCDRKQAIPDDEDRRGIISKAKGQLARLAMILHVLKMALDDVDDWSTLVTKEDVEHAQIIIDFVIEQKFRLMPPEVKVHFTTDFINPNISDNYLSKFLSFKTTPIQASEVAQFRLMPPSPLTPGSKNKYPIEKVKEFMETVADAGFGKVIEGSRSAGAKRKTTTFQRYAYEDLGKKQQETWKRLKIDDQCSSDSANSSFLYSNSDSSSLPNQHPRTIVLSTPSTSDSQSDSSRTYDSDIDM